MAEALRSHDVKLVDSELTLRPLSEADWPTIALWNQDPDVLWFSEGDRIEFRPLEEVQSIYRGRVGVDLCAGPTGFDEIAPTDRE